MASLHSRVLYSVDLLRNLQPKLSFVCDMSDGNSSLLFVMTCMVFKFHFLSLHGRRTDVVRLDLLSLLIVGMHTCVCVCAYLTEF